MIKPTWPLVSSIVFGILLACGGTSAQDQVGYIEAKPIKRVEPRYPRDAKVSGLGGRVTLDVTIDDSGKVISIDNVAGPGWVCPAVTSKDVVALRSAAREAVLRTKFFPAKQNDVPVRATIKMDFDFIPPAKKPVKENSKPVQFTIKRDDGSASDSTNSNGVLNHKAISLGRPIYPPLARMRRVTGTVEVQVLILEDGTIFSAEPILGHQLLLEPSRIAACDSRFSQTFLEGKPVKVSGTITYNFVR